MNYFDESLYFEAANIANDLARKAAALLDKDLTQIKCYDIQKYVEQTENVVFTSYDFGSKLREIMLGSTSEIDGVIVIATNKSVIVERKNFSEMHETMHVYCDVKGGAVPHAFTDMILEDGYLSEDEPKEYRANIGASVLMSNDEALKYALRKFKNFDEVANYFFMSKAALMNRLKDYLVFVQNCTPEYAFRLCSAFRYGRSSEFFRIFYR